VTTALLSLLASPPYKLRTAAFSLDDLYLPHEGLVRLSDANPGNKLLAGRGLPGSHDIDLGKTVLGSLHNINQTIGTANTVCLPIFDKSLFGGEGDRSIRSVPVQGPLDVVLFEGWSVGFCPLEEQELALRYSSAQQEYQATPRKIDPPAFLRHSLQDLLMVNRLLERTADSLWRFFTVFVQLELALLSQIYYWRLEQEHAMMLQNGGIGMTDEQVRVFVDRYLPGYELWMDGIQTGRYAEQWQGRGLSLVYGVDRQVLRVKTF
jgi:D-glycerate 3-kinase